MALSVSALMGFDCMSLGDGIYLQQLHQKTTDLQDIYDISRAVVEAQGKLCIEAYLSSIQQATISSCHPTLLG